MLNGGIICTEGFNSAYHADENGCINGGRGSCSVKAGGKNDDCAAVSPGTLVQQRRLQVEMEVQSTTTASLLHLSSSTSAIVRSVAGSLTDLAQVKSSANTALSATEIGDTSKPSIVSASIDFNNGNLVIVADEVLDLFDPSLSVIPSNISLRNASEAALDTVSLDGVDWVAGISSASIEPTLTFTSAIPHLGLGFTVRLSEAMRVSAIERSNTPGGTPRTAAAQRRRWW